MSDVMDFDEDDLKRRMDGAIESLRKEFGGLRTGRASASLLDPIKVDVDNARTAAARFGVMSVPTVILIKAGDVKDQMIGLLSKQALAERIDKVL